jgi:hypothetical protein
MNGPTAPEGTAYVRSCTLTIRTGYCPLEKHSTSRCTSSGGETDGPHRGGRLTPTPGARNWHLHAIDAPHVRASPLATHCPGWVARGG